MKQKNNLLKYIDNSPLTFIIVVSIIFRVLSVIFAKGFGMFDDHFLYIQTPQTWVDGWDDGRWLPWTAGNNGTQGHSFTYPGFNFLTLWFLKFIGINSPDIKMYFIRFIHALLSLITVIYGYKISEKISNKKGAFITGILLASLWLFPWLSVRNLVEIVCIPFLILSVWVIIKYDYNENKNTNSKLNLIYLISGLWSGVAFSIRFQVAFFILGLGVAILIQKGFRKSLFYVLGFVILTFLTQGIVDFLIWKQPFAEFIEYVNYNINHSGDYPNGPWYNYLLLILGVLIPPLSLIIVFGFLKSWRKYFIIFLPTFIFLFFHSYFPNKQERFIFPIIPFIIISGISGWFLYRENNQIKWLSKKTENGILIFALIINFIFLIPVSTMYSKKTRVESMVYLSKYNKINSILIENSTENNSQYPPLFYLGQKTIVYTSNIDSKIDTTNIPWSKEAKPDFVLFYTEENLEMRLIETKKLIPHLVFEKTIYPSFVDNILFKLNPKFNKNYIVNIYKNIEN